MTLYDYLKTNLTRQDPYPAIDHAIRAELHADGRISFYIHAAGRDSVTEDYWVKDNTLKEKRLCDEPLPEPIWKEILDITYQFGAFRGFGDSRVLCIPFLREYTYTTIAAAIESVGHGVKHGYQGTEGDDYFIFQPYLG